MPQPQDPQPWLEAARGLPPDRLLGIIRFQTEVAKAGLDLGEVMERVAPLAQALTGAGGAVVELAEEQEMVYRAASGMAASQLGFRVVREGSLSGLAMAEGRSLVCQDSEADPRVDRPACRIVGLRSMIVVPLRHAGQTVGVLKVLDGRPGVLEEADLRTLELISEVVAAAMAHAARYAAQVDTARDLFQRATRDALTGLGNRALFYDRLHQTLRLARRERRSVGVVLVDMDGLKPLNDTFGHLAGDEALRALAGRLQASVRASDTLARLGGDEFAILLASVRDPAAARGLASKLADQLQGEFTFGGRTFPLAASLGVAVFPEDGEDPEALVRRADAAMYEMKRHRKAERRS